MAIAQSRKVELSEIPVVDLGLMQGNESDRERLGAELREACESVGFFYVANHGVPGRVTGDIFDQAHRFFALPIEERRSLTITRSPVYRGYLAIGERGANLNRPADILESLNLGCDLGPDHPDVNANTPLHGPNQWPTSLPGFREAVTSYQQTMLRLADTILQALAFALEIPFASLWPMFSPPMTQMRLLHYAPQPPDVDCMIGARPHQDTSFFTILLQDDVGGLEVQARNGEWLVAPPRPDMFVVNAGEFLELMTCGFFSSAMHRVVNRSSAQRYSVPFFVSPGYSTILSPLPQFAARAGARQVEAIHIGNTLAAFFRSLWPSIGVATSTEAGE
jgi:isopenicillin N synthase-like dioxygenase